MHVDTSNAFNSLNKAVSLQKSNSFALLFRPFLSTHTIFSAPLHVDIIYSNEGSTQGDPLALSLYAFSTTPLFRKLQSNVIHTSYADDASACGQISDLRLWWDQISSLGPPLNYFPNTSKTWLVVRD